MKKIIIGISISIFLLLWAFWGVEWNLIGKSLGQVRWVYIFIYLMILLALQAIRSIRWQILLSPLLRVEQNVLFPITSVGFLAILYFPVRSGELVRPYLLSQQKNISLSAALATIVLERILDLVTILVFIIFTAFSAQLPKWVLGAGYLAAALVLVILTFMALFILKESLVMKIFQKIFKPFSSRITERINNFILSFNRGAHILFNWRVMISSFIASIALWGGVAISNYMMFYAFSLSLPFLAALVLVVIIDLGLFIPAAPGFVGSFQFFCTAGLALFGVQKESALSYSILTHALQLLMVTALGLIFLPAMKMKGFLMKKKNSHS